MTDETQTLPVRGQLNGDCTTVDCENKPVTFLNKLTGEYYCHPCAVAHNRATPQGGNKIDI